MKNRSYNQFSIVATVHAYHYSHWKHAGFIIVLQFVIVIQIYNHDPKASHLRYISQISECVYIASVKITSMLDESIEFCLKKVFET